MSTYTQLTYHIVFGTKGRQMVLDESRREDLFRYIWGIIKNKGGHLHRIGGFDDHLHILVALPASVAIADVVKEVKTSSNKWIKEKGAFPGFGGWQEGYGAFTCCHEERPAIIEYIKGQKEHHRTRSFDEEFRAMLVKAGVEFDERYLV
jgi:putative transposase